MRPRILIIEDNLEMADNLSSILELANYSVKHAPDGKLGVQFAQQTHPDLILCDIMMPELDGYGVLHILRKHPETASIPFIFLTAKADKNDFRTGMNLGADDYIAKPFDGLDVLKVIEMRLKKNGITRSDFVADEDINAFFNEMREAKALKNLLEGKPTRSFKRKDILFAEGQPANDLYYIQKGKVKLYKINYDGKELITGLLNEGDFLGYVSLLEEKAYYENAEALEDVRLIIIAKLEFLKMLYSSKDVAHAFIKMLSHNLEEVETRLVELAYQSVRQRVAGALLKINEKLTGGGNPAITIVRKDISNLVGTATESLNRTLADFKEEGLIEISDDGLRIINKTKLERLLH